MAQRIGQSKVLGIAIGERSLVVAEAVRAGETPRITLAASFVYPPDVGLEGAGGLGEALATFLKDKGFTARQAVIGVPARWVLSKSKEVPPAEPSVITELLRLQVEGEFSQELRDLSFDYAGQISTSEPRQVLLVALQGKHLEQVKAVADAAKLQLIGVTPVGSVLGAATAAVTGKARHAMVVSVGPGGVELVALDGPDTPRVLRHLGGSSSSPALLAGELRRATFAAGGLPTVAPASGKNGVNGNGNGHGRSGPALVLWDNAALSDASRRALADAAGVRLEQGDLQTLGVPEGLNGSAADVAGAAALAVAALSDEPLPANFLRSKLAEPKKFAIPPKTMIAIGGGVLAVVLIVLAVLSISSLNKQKENLESQLEDRKQEIEENQEFLDRVRFAERWHSRDPKFLNFVNDMVTILMQMDNGRDPLSYITDINIHEPSTPIMGSAKPASNDMMVTMTGKAPNVAWYSSLIDRINSAPRTKVAVPRFQKAGNSELVTFVIQLTYTPPQSGKSPAPATQPSGRSSSASSRK